MKIQKVIIAFFLLLAFAYAKGQDKIITVKNDTIYCKIISISLKSIKYEQEDSIQITVRNSIPMKKVQEYSLGKRSQTLSCTQLNRGQSIKPFLSFLGKEQTTNARWKYDYYPSPPYLSKCMKE